MKNRFLNWGAISEMLDHDSFEERRSHPVIPDAFRVHDDDRSAAADAEARSLSTLHSVGAEEETLTLQEVREEGVEL